MTVVLRERPSLPTRRRHVEWDYQYPPVRTAAGCRYALTNPSPGVFTCDAPITLHPVLQYERFRFGFRVTF